jgi:hypothetical protein
MGKFAPEGYREQILDLKRQGLSLSQIAERMGKSIAAIRFQLAKEPTVASKTPPVTSTVVNKDGARSTKKGPPPPTHKVPPPPDPRPRAISPDELKAPEVRQMLDNMEGSHLTWTDVEYYVYLIRGIKSGVKAQELIDRCGTTEVGLANFKKNLTVKREKGVWAEFVQRQFGDRERARQQAEADGTSPPESFDIVHVPAVDENNPSTALARIGDVELTTETPDGLLALARLSRVLARPTETDLAGARAFQAQVEDSAARLAGVLDVEFLDDGTLVPGSTFNPDAVIVCGDPVDLSALDAPIPPRPPLSEEDQAALLAKNPGLVNSWKNL